MRRSQPWLIGAAALAMASLLGTALTPYVSMVPTTIFLLAVILTAWKGNFASGCVVTVACGFVRQWMHVTRKEPGWGGEDWGSVVLFLVVGFVATLLISRLRMREQALREVEHRFLLVNRATNEVIYDWDLVHKELHWNEGLTRTFGYPLEDVPTTLEWWTERVHPRDRDQVNGTLYRSLEDSSKNSWTAEYQFRRRDGSWAHVLDRAYIQRDERGRAVRMIGSMIDLTERKQAEEALRESELKLRRSNEWLEERVRDRTAELEKSLTSIEELLYTIAHDLKAPNRALNSFAQMLLDEYGERLDETGREYLARLRKAAVRNDALITDLLELGRFAHARFTLAPVCLRDVARQALQRVEPAILEKKGQVELPRDLPRVWADSSALETMFCHLFSNAIEYIAPGVRPKVSVRAEQADGSVRVFVEDNGVGLPEHVHEKAFLPFVRFAPEGDERKTGMGLAIVRKAADRMGAKVGVLAKREGGSCFWMEFRGAE